MTDERPVRDEVLEEHARLFVREVAELLRPIKNDLTILVEHGRTVNERLLSFEHRLTTIERQVGLNGTRQADTEPAPETVPENERPEEPGGP